jgi:hypothetical protein
METVLVYPKEEEDVKTLKTVKSLFQKSGRVQRKSRKVRL